MKKGNEFTQKGFSLVELLLVLAILSVILVVSLPLGAGFVERNSMDTKISETVNALRVAQINSISGKEDGSWGVRIENNQIVLFKGISYVARDSVFDEVYEIPSRVIVSGVPVEVVFDTLNGDPTQIFTLSFSNQNGDSANVSINEVGVVDVN